MLFATALDGPDISVFSSHNFPSRKKSGPFSFLPPRIYILAPVLLARYSAASISLTSGCLLFRKLTFPCPINLVLNDFETKRKLAGANAAITPKPAAPAPPEPLSPSFPAKLSKILIPESSYIRVNSDLILFAV